MTDKELIKQEIERRISQFEAKYPKDLGGYWNDEESAAFDCAEEYKEFLLFIDSLPEEPYKPNYCHHEVDLSDCSEEYRKAYYDGWNNCNMQHDLLKNEQFDYHNATIITKDFAGKHTEEPASEDKSEKELAETYLAVFDKKHPILPTLKGKQKADFKNFLNKCQQEFGLKEFGIHPTQSKLFEKLTLLWATWGAEHLEGLGKSNQDELDKEPASEDLEEAAVEAFKKIVDSGNNSFLEIFKAGAEWQKQKDLEDSLKSDMTMPNKFYEKGKADAMIEIKEALQTEYEKGRFDMREEMMKDAVEGEVVYKIGNAEIAPTDVRYKVMSDRVYIPNVKLGDKVKIIICKTEQQ